MLNLFLSVLELHLELFFFGENESYKVRKKEITTYLFGCLEDTTFEYLSFS